MKWARQWWWLIAVILAVALVVVWKEKSCQTQSYQCRANYTAELSPRLTVDQQAAAQQAIAAACEPNAYFCRLFSAANLPTVLLVLIGAGAVWAALRTLVAIEKQADAMVKSDRAWVIPEVVPMAKRKSDQWFRWIGGGKTVPMSENEILRGEHLRHGLKFINMGRTVARISAYDIHIGLFDWKKELLRIQEMHQNGEFDRTLAGGETTEVLADEIIDINEVASNPAAEIETWKNWLVVLVMVSYQHVFSGGEPETEVFRFVYDPKKMKVSRKATTEADKKQARDPQIWPAPNSDTTGGRAVS
jgi:hypothetical protein